MSHTNCETPGEASNTQEAPRRHPRRKAARPKHPGNTQEAPRQKQETKKDHIELMEFNITKIKNHNTYLNITLLQIDPI